MTFHDRGPAGGAVGFDHDDQLVRSAQSGDRDAFGALFDRWFARVFDVAYRIVRDQEVAAEVTQDVFLVAWTHLSGITQPASFGGWLLRTARNRAINRLERERRSTAVGDEEMAMHVDRSRSDLDPTDALHRAEQVGLVWAAADALGERDVSLLDLHLRHGLEAPELAEALGVTVNNAHQLLFRMRKRLRTALGGWVLWRGGRPDCPELASGLRLAGIASFGPAAVSRIDRHADGCAACLGRREQRFGSEAMFAAAPLVAVAPWVQTQVAAALQSAGVPMQGSVAMGGAETVGAWPDGPGDVADHLLVEPIAGADADAGATDGGRRRRRRRARGMTVAAVVLFVVATVYLAGPLGRDAEIEERTVVDDRSHTPPDALVPSTAFTVPAPAQPQDDVNAEEGAGLGEPDPPVVATPTTMPPTTAAPRPPATSPPTTPPPAPTWPSPTSPTSPPSTEPEVTVPPTSPP
jgi:RNA polymerase sigma factor (sigma-70 family)